MQDIVEREKEKDLPLEQKYLALLVAAHYLGGALRRLKENGKISPSDLQVVLTESGNDVEDGRVARFLREEAARVGVERSILDDVIARGFTDAFNFIHEPQITEDR